MLCSIDPESCYGAAVGWDVWISLGVVALVMVVVTVLYPVREFIGGMVVLIFGAALLISIGLLQVLFVASFVPAVFFFTLAPADGNWRRWRAWPWQMLAGPVLFLPAIALAIFMHEQGKVAATACNLIGTVLLLWGWLKYLSRTDEPAKS